MRELHKITAGAHAPVLRDKLDDVGIDHPDEQFHQVRMDTRPGLQESSETGDHRRLDIDVRQRLPRSRGMASDDVVLEVDEILVIHPPLGHRAEARIDAVNNLL